MADEVRELTAEPSTRWLTWLVGGLAVCLVWALIFSPGSPGPVGADRAAAARMLSWIDEERARHDLPPLAATEDMTAVAEAWSATMAEMHSMEHNPRFGEQLCCWAVATENVAYGEAYRVRLPGDPVERVTRELHEELLASPGHRANLLDPDVDQIGIGIHLDAAGTVWITQNFRRYQPHG